MLTVHCHVESRTCRRLWHYSYRDLCWLCCSRNIITAERSLFCNVVAVGCCRGHIVLCLCSTALTAICVSYSRGAERSLAPEAPSELKQLYLISSHLETSGVLDHELLLDASQVRSVPQRGQVNKPADNVLYYKTGRFLSFGSLNKFIIGPSCPTQTHIFCWPETLDPVWCLSECCCLGSEL